MSLLERLVNIVAPRNIFDFVFKAFIMLLMLGALNYLRDVLEHENGHDGFWNNFYEASFVGAPFVILTFAAIGHMNTLHHKLARLAATDMLTGLPNRRAFMEAAEQVRRCGPGDILMMVDVDHFKKVNDTYGHSVGDLCLQHLAEHMCGQVRASDIVARMGGEEFAILLRGATLPEGQKIAEQIAKGRMIMADENTFHVTMSVGYLERCNDTPLERILKLADGALYQAKANGRARTCQANCGQNPLVRNQAVTLTS